MASEGSKKVIFQIKKNKTLVSKKNFPTGINFNGGLDILFLIQKICFLLLRQRGGSKCFSLPLEGIKKKKIQTEIDFDWSRLPLGAAIRIHFGLV